jgi:hypothetical protein
MSATVPKLWPGATVVCIASGPSLVQDDVDDVRGKARVIAINTCYKLAPWADVLYAADEKWWRWHKGVPEFTGLRYSLDRIAVKWDVTILSKSSTTGLDMRPTHLARGMNSGYQAINLAVHLGAARIVLLGYDMQRGPKGQEHWHPDHPNGSRSPYPQFAACFPSLVEPLKAAGAEVVNCSRVSALKCFPRRELRDVLAESAVAA